MKKGKKILLGIFVICIIFILGIVIYNYFSKVYAEYKYNKTKDYEIEKMAEYISNKYNEKFYADECIYYKEEDYEFHGDIFGNGKDYNIPYIAIFEKNNEQITVVDRKGKVSDDRQLKDLNNIISNYFSNVVGCKIDFVQIKEVHKSGNYDIVINDYIQNHFNDLITNTNIEEFIKGILKEDNLELIFFLKDTDNREQLIDTITTNLNYLKENENIKKVQFYIYDKNEDLVINCFEKRLEKDYYDEYKFDYYYVVTKSGENNTFLTTGTMNLDRGYGSGKGKIVNGWTIREE